MVLPRLLFVSFYIFAAITILLLVCELRSKKFIIDSAQPVTSKGVFKDLFNFRAPAALFPPSALISLTDDNATFFIARPAAFGPPLPPRGLSGQIWVADAFEGQDTEFNRALDNDYDDFGCGDISGRGGYMSHTRDELQPIDTQLDSEETYNINDWITSHANEPSYLVSGDGSDDRIKRQIINRGKYSDTTRVSNSENPLEHADIQSLQESAEIAGKIVLLRRGGCGFVEKVMWAQRRGGIAVIVGDNVPGRALVTMFARQDALRVTIPALFTTYTTAQFLSSLIPTHELRGTATACDKFSRKIQEEANCHEQFLVANQPHDSFEEDLSSPKEKAKSSDPIIQKLLLDDVFRKRGILKIYNEICAWLSELLKRKHSEKAAEDLGDYPRSSGNSYKMKPIYSGKQDSNWNSQGEQAHMPLTQGTDISNPDDFIIGVHDWRDPDIVEYNENPVADAAPSKSLIDSESNNSFNDSDQLVEFKGNTPDSGVYESSDIDRGNRHVAESEIVRMAYARSTADKKNKYEATEKLTEWTIGNPDIHDPESNQSKDVQDDHEGDGLWVTMVPAKMSSSPFFDTLLILVVSPLVTLMIVYALLLLRTRLRRRRWRAPKSLVERLPVRTYQTISSEPSSYIPSPTAPPSISTSTPLLNSLSVPTLARKSYRPTFTSTIQESSGRTEPCIEDEGLPHRLRTSSDRTEQKHEYEKEVSSRPKRRYGGNQRECVICLEEYIDGVSRVMSLPCGHDFHAECITPWLTTRRRTCPICKNDVVRCFAYGVHSSGPHPSTCDAPANEDDRHDHTGRTNNTPTTDGNNNVGNLHITGIEWEGRSGDIEHGGIEAMLITGHSVSASTSVNSNDLQLAESAARNSR